MKSPVKIKTLIEALEFLSDDSDVYLNTITGEVVTIPDRVAAVVDIDEHEADLQEMQQEILEKAREEVSSEEYIQLMAGFAIDEYRIMEDFCLFIRDDQLSYVLCKDIQGKGAFKRFKEDLYRYGLEDRWYEYRDKVLKDYVKKWCEDQGILYIDD